MPERIQLSRRKGWRKPENTVVVARPSKWGNPYVLGKAQVRMPAVDGPDTWEHEGRLYKRSGEKHPFFHGDETITWHQVENATAEQVVQLYREYVTGETRHTGYRHASRVEEIIAELRGKNLACWCPLDQPCHADVLLELANAEVTA